MSLTLKITPDGNVEINAATGRPSTLTGSVKARQDIRQMLTLAEQSDGNYAGLEQELRDTPASSEAFSARIQQRLRAAFLRLQQLQRLRPNARTSDEVFTRIAQMYVVPATLDGKRSQTGYLLRFMVLTRRGEEVLLQIGLAT